MSYKIDRITMNEWWDEYATTPHKNYADEIAAQLLAKGETVRVSEIRYDLKLGPTLTPGEGAVGRDASGEEKGDNGKLCNSPGAARPPGEKGNESR